MVISTCGIWIAFLLFVQLHHVHCVPVPCETRTNGPDVCECIYSSSEKTCEFELEITYQVNCIGNFNCIKINDNFPGPTLIIQQDQYVEAKVMNRISGDIGIDGRRLYWEGITIHWHGMHQTDTPWMDGVGKISQSPIPYGGDMTYYFRPSRPTPPGTHWYHSHVGEERTAGLFGALIVKERGNYFRDTIVRLITDGTPYRDVQDIPSEHTLTLLDIYSVTDKKFKKRPSLLINGIGRTEFSVNRGSAYRFRVVGAQNKYAYKLSIDNHRLRVIASDGHFFTPREVDFLIVHSGERYDFVVHANQIGDQFCICATPQDLPPETTTAPPAPPGAAAILRYGSADSESPTCQCACTRSSTCETLNCLEEGDGTTETCIRLNNVSSLNEPTRAQNEQVPEIESINEYVSLNFDFEGQDGTDGITASVNGRNFKDPDTPYQTHCGIRFREQTCMSGGIKCTHIIPIAQNRDYPEREYETVIMVFTSLSHTSKSAAHPVHLHGHSFYILYSGFDVSCDYIDGYCQPDGFSIDEVRSRSGMVNTHIQKDTVVVPKNGYVVIAFLANNPGYWFLHCHIENHLTDGMAVLVEEYSYTQHSEKPKPKDLMTLAKFVEFADSAPQDRRRCPRIGGDGGGGNNNGGGNGASVDRAGPITIAMIELIAVLLSI